MILHWKGNNVWWEKPIFYGRIGIQMHRRKFAARRAQVPKRLRTRLTSAPTMSATAGWPRLDFTLSYATLELPHVISMTWDNTRHQRVRNKWYEWKSLGGGTLHINKRLRKLVSHFRCSCRIEENYVIKCKTTIQIRKWDFHDRKPPRLTGWSAFNSSREAGKMGLEDMAVELSQRE